MVDITRRLGDIAKQVEKYDLKDTTRVIGMVLHCLPMVIKPSEQTEGLLNSCRIYAEHCETAARSGDPEPGSRRHNLILLHSIKTLREAEDHLLDSDYGNARELCMLCYRRGREFLPEDIRPSVTTREIRSRLQREKKIEEKRGLRM